MQSENEKKRIAEEAWHYADSMLKIGGTVSSVEGVFLRLPDDQVQSVFDAIKSGDDASLGLLVRKLMRDELIGDYARMILNE